MFSEVRSTKGQAVQSALQLVKFAIGKKFVNLNPNGKFKGSVPFSTFTKAWRL
jgi:hypothetical protein